MSKFIAGLIVGCVVAAAGYVILGVQEVLRDREQPAGVRWE